METYDSTQIWNRYVMPNTRLDILPCIGNESLAGKTILIAKQLIETDTPQGKFAAGLILTGLKQRTDNLDEIVIEEFIYNENVEIGLLKLKL